ncbi:Metallo-dependent hydrolase [Sistotremastrum niveocremeum HHB9708]|uniref:Metallo-dependent hydrolase n=1 Tax=Sistotremastrum niveocremeum HHB9708 TaxID=1314777 RepID=A0A164UPM1_9AGAM|nr:Metallo-dependent hydrolase [Sistotremastrum niveocremeum HHB9708]
MALIFRGTLVQCITPRSIEILEDHILRVNEDGFISDIYPYAGGESPKHFPGDPEIIQMPPFTFLFPGFCDLHLHAAQFLYMGSGLHLPLMRWLDEYAYKAEERLDKDPALARAVYCRLAQRLVENGTTSTLLFGTIGEETNLILAKAFQDAGIRGFVGKLSMDISSRPSYTEHSAAESVAAAKGFIKKCKALVAPLPAHRRLVHPVITPRFVPTCSEPLLQDLAVLASEECVRVQSHLAEARDMIDYVSKEYGVSDFEIFKRTGLLRDNAVYAHCTYLTDLQMSELSRRKVSIANCPLSNCYFSSEPFRGREAIDLGVNVALGTDVAGGYSIDMMNSMRHAVTVSKIRDGQAAEEDSSKSLVVDWIESLYLATRGGAAALGLGDLHGTFTVGAAFDAQMVQLVDPESHFGKGALDFFDTNPSKAITLEHIEKWWCMGDEKNRIGLWVQGRNVWPQVTKT